jgi:cell division control protein 7
MSCLFQALADSHSKMIIHRDVKPANFLFNPLTGQGTLCDFGLAEVFDPYEWHSKCLHSLPAPHAKLYHGTRLSRPRTVIDQLGTSLFGYTTRTEPQDEPWFPSTEQDYKDLEGKAERDAQWHEDWEPAKISLPGKKVGYLKPEHDKRSGIRANRAGTRGFRAPEVLFKCPDQTFGAFSL